MVNSMKPIPKLLLALAFALSIGGGTRAQDFSRGQLNADVTSHAPAFSSIPVASGPPALGIHPTITHYATRFDGDRSLEEATVVEQAFARYTLYTVRLQFASGVEQSVVLTAPPGGLDPEIRDMSGDSVPNDLILSSRLLRLPLIVLLNEGHDHLTVAISPGAFTSGEDHASGPHQLQRALALASTRFKAGRLADSGALSLLQLREKFPSPATPIHAKSGAFSSTSGRAPPELETRS
jgi:hypothetical protein